eukprot:TRINITY_DN13600_c0_g1_i4.p1 TRINITY_DN13600_c0_g1~~TRINITY_DN13600_c0_g1_i4.p1  ORF type:complete len:284 (+),score=137.10 TRINITY_DN13600_c0_g1_i4:101-952(+)
MCIRDSTGVYLWANTDRLSPIELRASAATGTQALPSAMTEAGENEDDDLLYDAPCTGVVSLSGVPRPNWANLAMLDQIKARNKAKAVTADKEEAPFFLPTLPGLDPKFIAAPEAEPEPEGAEWAQPEGAWQDSDNEGSEDEDMDEDANEQPKKRKELGRGAESVLLSLLKAESEAGEGSKTMEHLKSLGPSALDVEVRMIDVQQDLVLLLELFKRELAKGTNYELLQAELGHVLRVHGLEIAASAELKEVACELLEAHGQQWERVEDLLQYNLCLLGHLTRLQ